MADYEQFRQTLEERPALEHISPAGILELPEPLRESILRILCRGEMSLEQLAADLALSQDDAERLAALLVDKGILAESEENPGAFQINLGRRKSRTVPTDIWAALARPPDEVCGIDE